MTLPDLEERYFPYLAEHPPLHLLVGAYLGLKPKNATAIRGPAAAQKLRSAVSDMPPGLRQALSGARDDGLPPAVLDFEELKRTMARRS